EEDVDRLSAHLSQALRGIGRAAHHLDTTGGRQHARQARQRQWLVVDEERAQARLAHASRTRGSVTVTSVPPSRGSIDSAAASPYRAWRRPWRFSSPCPACSDATVKPGPSSQTPRRRTSPAAVTLTRR